MGMNEIVLTSAGIVGIFLFVIVGLSYLGYKVRGGNVRRHY